MDDVIQDARELHSLVWEAYRQEETERELLYVDGTYTVAGIEIPAISARSFNILCAINSPYVCGGMADESSACMLLWVVYREQAKKPWWFHFRSLRKKREWFFKRLDRTDVRSEVSDYVDAVFLDAPRGSGKGGDAIAAGVVYFTHVLLLTYRQFTREYILSLPLPVIYQHMKVIRKTNDPDAKFQGGPKVKKATKRYFRFLGQNNLKHSDVFQNN